MPGFLFGCAHRTEEFQSHGVLAGVLSLGRRRRDGSLVTELAKRGVHRFSYCLLGPRWPGRRGFLRFGDDAPATGRMQRTRIERCIGEGDDGVHNRVYSVRLAGVSVAGRRLPGRRLREHLPGHAVRRRHRHRHRDDDHGDGGAREAASRAAPA